MAAYLTITQFKLLTTMPAGYVDDLEAVAAGWVDSQLSRVSAYIDSRLRKRYAVPFAAPVPEAVTGWLADLVTARCFLRRGVDPNDEQFALIKEDADRAMRELEEAANSETGLFDLPLRNDTTATGISKGGPLSYTEASPYVWTDVQAETGRNEDSNRGGSYG